VICALTGGLWPALTAGVVSSLLLNFFFTPPVHTLGIASVEDLVALMLFLLVAVAVASVVGEAARRAVQADLARRESDTLSLLNQTLLRGDHDMTALLDLVRDTFAMTSAALLVRPDLPAGPATSWQVLASSGPDPARSPEHGDVSAAASATARLVLRGRPLPAHDIRVLSAFATHLAVAADRERLAAQTAVAQRLEEGNRLRTALLAAVSHDLRTPLAGIKAAVSTLRTPEVTWSREDEADLLAAIEESADRLGAIIANLLDLTRLQTGAVQLVTQDVGLDDVVARTVRRLPDADRIDVDVSSDLPAVRVDVGLLERVTANLVENALRYSPRHARVEVTAEAAGPWVRLRVTDHGPGIAEHDRERLFQPFQRLGDAPAGEGVGLGLAVAAGLTAAVGGNLTAGKTPGGGLTMLVDVPAVPGEHLDELPTTHTGRAADATPPSALRPT
jgi:two-component system sensor histidine kinase KdpD